MDEKETVESIQAEIRSLVNERNALSASLRGHSFIDRRNPRHKLGQALQPADTDRRKAFSRRSNLGTGSNRSFVSEELVIEARPKIETNDVVQDRHKRIFATGILGHLKRAKDDLEKQSETTQAHMHRDKDRIIEKKLEVGRKNILELKRRYVKQKRMDGVQKMNTLMENLVAKEDTLIRKQLIAHYENMKSYIGTDTQPTIFWGPGEWTDKATEKSVLTARFIEKKIETIRNTKYHVFTPKILNDWEGSEPVKYEDQPKTAESDTPNQEGEQGEVRTPDASPMEI